VSGGTVVLAFAILMFARYKGLSSLGVAAVIGIGAAVICSVTFLPAILRILEKRRKIGRAFAHLPGTVIDYPVPETEYEPPESEP